MAHQQSYYVPEQSKLPIIATLGLFTMLVGAASGMIDGSKNIDGNGWTFFFIGFAVMLWVFYSWFGIVIKESMSGLYDAQMDRSFRWGMSWFIFSEVMFFAAFFGALFYVRTFAVPWLGGEGDKGVTNLLWEGFSAQWPLLANPDSSKFVPPSEIIGPWGLPLLNTILLVTSSVTVTFAHHALKAGERKKTIIWMWATVALGATFLGFQVEEYIHAYSIGLTLQSGIYGTTFFMLTGFHGLHVTIGTIMLLVITLRLMKGHFSPEKHFGFEAVAWYWHFVDVVWIGLFVFVYIF